MCLIVAGWQVHPEFPLVVAANRDEFHARPTDAAACSGTMRHKFLVGAIGRLAVPGWLRIVMVVLPP